MEVAASAAGTPVISTVPRPACPLCGGAGDVVHKGLGDPLYDVPGQWSFRRCRGPHCGLWWLDPVPRAEDLGLAYASYFTHAPRPPRPSTLLRRLIADARAGYRRARYGGPPAGIGARALAWTAHLHPGWKAEIHHRAMHLPVQPGRRLLEVGCGTGDLLAGVAALGWQVTGVDFDPQAVAVARSRGLDVREGDLPGQAFADGAFAAVTMFHVIEHVPDPRALLVECRRVLAPDGALVVATPNPAGRGHARFGRSWLGLDPPRHLHLFPPALLAAEVERAGFRVQRLFTTCRDAEVIAAGSRAIARTGHYAFGSAIARRERLRTLAYLFTSWLAGLLGADRRDETVVVAARP